MSLTQPYSYEVEAGYLQLVDPDGHKHWLTRGAQLPDWVQPETIEELVASGALARFEVLGNG